jgi:hypothetical protein
MAMRYPGGLIATSPVNAAYPSGVWTQSQTIPYASQNVWQRDQYWRNTTLLLHGDGTNGAQNNTFLDSSSNNFTITRNGNTTQGAFTPYQQNGYWSNYFNGTDAYLITGTSSNLTLANNADWTVEAWIFLSASTYQQILFNSGGGSDSWSTQHNCDFAVNSSGFLSFEYSASGTPTSVAGTTATTRNAWNHIAWVFNGTSKTLTTYVNGVRDLNATSVSGYTPPNATPRITIGRTDPTVPNPYQWWVTGYISNVRVVRGSQVYSGATITVPTGPLTAITNTSLLTCQSNRFVDNSSNAFAITVSGSPSVQAFQPFPGATTWSASVLGGSGYFDGSGDYLLPASNSAFNFGTGDFTVEAWVYQPASGTQCVYDSRGSDASSAGFFFGTISTNFVVYTGGTSVISTAMPLNAWTHLAVARSGSTWTLYKNGVSAGTYSSSANLSDANRQIGASTTVTSSSANYLTGYISDLRVVKGTAVYTTGFTPPTAPLTAITNTSLLCSFTNAGIFDNAQMNDLETVGNAQVSTSVVKYGTGSMAFDGSGDYLVGRTTDLLSFNTGDFTVEMWVYPNSVAGNIVLIDTRSSGTDSGWAFYINSSSKLALFTSNADRITAGSALSASTWTHVVLARSGSTLAIYMNGVQSATATYSTTMTCPGRISIASGFDNAAPLNGYIDDLRITKGVARYISTFTPPIARMPNQ